MGSGQWPRDWLVQFQVTSHKWSRRLFGSGEMARKFAKSVRDAGGSAVVTNLRAEREKLAR